MQFYKGIYLENTTAGHNKHYFIAIFVCDTGAYAVHTAYGKIGNVPVENSKIANFLKVDDAEKLVHVLCNEKLNKGYVLGNLSAGTPAPASWNHATVPAPPIKSGGSNGGKVISAKRTSSIFEKRKRTAEWRF